MTGNFHDRLGEGIGGRDARGAEALVLLGDSLRLFREHFPPLIVHQANLPPDRRQPHIGVVRSKEQAVLGPVATQGKQREVGGDRENVRPWLPPQRERERDGRRGEKKRESHLLVSTL